MNIFVGILRCALRRFKLKENKQKNTNMALTWVPTMPKIVGLGQGYRHYL